ncbi:TLD domain-containing protein 2 [Athene cunicularia]|uniref:TLD domain-containing protein 2 n=1 Tax=Athene cunicularia TaxID=194338 RepID=UPI000EF70B90|nr:TLD domain-containing protein 2 [Athene cunicularia]
MRRLRAQYHLLPDQDKELPTGCREPVRERQPGWEGAPAVAPALKEQCRLMLSMPSSVLRDGQIQELGPHLPPRLTQQPWHLLYCTGQDGFSLRSLYQRGVFRWTGKNSFFLKGDVDLLMIGGGSGRFGLWLDGDLNHGGSHPCETFDNETLSSREEFCVQDLEVWGLA